MTERQPAGAQTGTADTNAQLGDAVTAILSAVRELIEAVLNRVTVLVLEEQTQRRILSQQVAELRERIAALEAERTP